MLPSAPPGPAPLAKLAAARFPRRICPSEIAVPHVLVLLLSLLLLFAAPAVRAAPAPRVAVESAAAAIEARYYDPERAGRIAADLRAAASRGEFDRFEDPRVLATELTNRLRPLDRHFVVTWSSEPRQAPAAAPGRAQPASDPARRGNYGFKRIEILPGNVGYIDMRGFAHFEDMDSPARLAADAALRLTDGADALIIDLRENGGGSPAMVGYLASAFVPHGSDIYNTFHSRQGTASEAPPTPYATPDTSVPLFILINDRTASAAEAFAYTLKNAKRAVVVGEASAGAANPGGTVALPGGLSIFISGGSPRSPITGGNWEGTGVMPDVATPASQALDRAQVLALQAALARGLQGSDRVDAEWALAALIAPPTPSQALEELAGEYSGVRIAVADGRLQFLRGRRPPWTLVAVEPDVFRDAADPSRRIRFIRDGKGGVTALETVFPDGPGGLYRRDG